jgi:hypothetical protein
MNIASVVRIWGRRRISTLIASVLCSLTILLAESVPGFAIGFPEDGVLDFAILRNGSEIGRHVYRFEGTGKSLVVRIEATIDYRFGIIPLYRFDHHATEVWRNGQLESMSATTRDNGDNYRIEVRPNGESLSLDVNGSEIAVEPDMMPASLWNIAIVKRGRILDPADGELMKVSIADAGDDTVSVRGRDIPARRYVMTGEFERDLWYDANGVLLQVRFRGDDGSEIRYGLR